MREYPYLNLPINSELRVRFLPDVNENNYFFWVNQYVVDFSKINDNFGKYIVNSISDLVGYLYDSDHHLYNDIIHSEYVYFHALILKDPLNEYENEIVKFEFHNREFDYRGKNSLFNVFKNQLMTRFDIDILLEKGNDFIISRKQNKEYPEIVDFSSSYFHDLTYSLSDQQIELIKNAKLPFLSSYLKPETERDEDIYKIFRKALYKNEELARNEMIKILTRLKERQRAK